MLPSLIKHLEIWGRVDNATNAHYATAGALNWNGFSDSISVQRFVAAGAPIAGWGGVKVRFRSRARSPSPRAQSSASPDRP